MIMWFLLIILTDIFTHISGFSDLLSNIREEILGSHRKGFIVEPGPHFAPVKCPENEKQMYTKAVLSGLTLT